MKTNSTNTSIFKPQLIAVLMLCIAATGCMVHEGHKKHVKPATFGTELSDLQTALDVGAITEQEYVVLKSRLMDSRDQ